MDDLKCDHCGKEIKQGDIGAIVYVYLEIVFCKGCVPEHYKNQGRNETEEPWEKQGDWWK